MAIKDLFTFRSAGQAAATPQVVGANGNAGNNPNNKNPNETYVHYGKRMCGLTNASSPAFLTLAA